MKNTFARLRNQLKSALNRLDSANRANNILNQEIERLRSAIDLQQSQINFLNSRLEEETKIKHRFSLRLLAAKKTSDKFYKNFIDEVSKRNKKESKLNTAIGIMATIITGLVIFILRYINV